MQTYSRWEDVPDNLKTRTGLKNLGLRPKRGQKPVAIKTHWKSKIPDYDLFDSGEAEPYTVSEKQRAALKKAQARSLEMRTCTRCGFVQELSRRYKRKVYVRHGLCDDCLTQLKQAADRSGAIEFAREQLQIGNALVLDTETTDLYGEVIELAITDLNGETLYNGRFMPSTPISAGAFAAHGITAESLADEPAFASEYPRIRAILESAPLVLIYNASFDVGRLHVTCQMYDVEPIKFKTACLMKWYAQYVNDWSNYFEDYRWHPLGGDHSALGDCRAALAVLREMAELEPVEEQQ